MEHSLVGATDCAWPVPDIEDAFKDERLMLWREGGVGT